MSSSAGMLIIYVVAFIAIFYFMAIRPQQRQRRAHQALLSSLKKGDQIITATGMYGTVKRVEDTVIIVEIAKGVTVKIARKAVAEIIREGSEARVAVPGPAGRRGRNAALEIEEESSAGDEAKDLEEVAAEVEDASSATELSEEESVRSAKSSSRRAKQ